MHIADIHFLWPTLSPRTVKEKTRLLFDGVLMKQIPLISIVSGTRIYPNLCLYLLVVGTFFLWTGEFGQWRAAITTMRYGKTSGHFAEGKVKFEGTTFRME